VQIQSHASNAPESSQASTPPAHTGTTPAARVFGLAPDINALIKNRDLIVQWAFIVPT
jgi:hypothetical protein